MEGTLGAMTAVIIAIASLNPATSGTLPCNSHAAAQPAEIRKSTETLD
jgi:hypothetical protein